jgi:hypothetical protein
VAIGHNYQLSFWIKSDKPGAGRISFPNGLTQQWPAVDWGSGETEDGFTTTTDWQQFSITITPDKEAVLKMHFEFGKVKGVTYYLDDVELVEVTE